VERNSRWFVIALTGWAFTLVGCATDREVAFTVPLPPTSLSSRPAVVTAPPLPVAPPRAALLRGASVRGRPLRCSVHGSGSDTVLFLGGIHGNEPAGVALCRQLASYLDRYPTVCAGRRVVIAPALNPDGLAAGRRTNARGVDLNRNFEARNRVAVRRHGRQPLSEPEARYIVSLIRRYRPARIVTLHQPLACVDWDGPAQGLAAAMGRASGLPARKLGARPGSLGSYAGVEQEIPIVTLELPAGASNLSPAGAWRIYGRSLLTAVRFPSSVASRNK